MQRERHVQKHRDENLGYLRSHKKPQGHRKEEGKSRNVTVGGEGKWSHLVKGQAGKQRALSFVVEAVGSQKKKGQMDRLQCLGRQLCRPHGG